MLCAGFAMLFLTEDQVRQSITPEAVIAALREAFARDFHATLRMPVRTSMELADGVLLLMPCHDTELNAAGVKMVTVTQKTGVKATYSLLDPVGGEVLAIMEANHLTDLRTAAASALATEMLASLQARTLGVFGSGRQARAHLTVLPSVRDFQRFLVCGSERSDLRDFCAKMKDEFGMKVEAVDAETCALESDVVCTCTTSAEPLFDGRWLKPGAHLNLVGAFQPHTREVDDETVRRARIVVDTYEGALAEAGDLLIPIANGVIARGHILADLHELVSGKRKVRLGAGDITLFKSVGCALEDLVTASLVFQNI